MGNTASVPVFVLNCKQLHMQNLTCQDTDWLGIKHQFTYLITYLPVWMNYPRCSRWMKVSASFWEEENPTRWPPVTITVLVPCHYACSAQHVKSIFLCVCVQGFFRRALQNVGDPARKKCFYNKNCEINMQTRNRCQYCRLQKCQALGMSRSGMFQLTVPSVQFSSVQDGICALGRAHVCFTPYLRCFASVAFETVLMFVWLLMAHSCPLKEDYLVLPLSTPLCSGRSVVWCRSPFTDHNGLLPFLWKKGKHCHGPCTAWL